MYAIYGNIYHQYTPNVSIYTIHGSYGIYILLYRIIIYNICIVCIYIYELFYTSIYNIIYIVMFFFLNNDALSCLVLL